MPTVRRLLHVRLLAIALLAALALVRTGPACAVVPAIAGSAQQAMADCHDAPRAPDRPVKAPDVHCATACAAVPDLAVGQPASSPAPSMPPVEAGPSRLAGDDTGPSPPPPRTV